MNPKLFSVVFIITCNDLGWIVDLFENLLQESDVNKVAHDKSAGVTRGIERPIKHTKLAHVLIIIDQSLAVLHCMVAIKVLDNLSVVGQDYGRFVGKVYGRFEASIDDSVVNKDHAPFSFGAECFKFSFSHMVN